MSCTTILAGTKATWNGSTLIARNDDNGNGSFSTKRLAIVMPDQQPRLYHSVISHLEIPLPDNPLKYTCVPNVDTSEKGIWAASGINGANVAMTATETITTNARVMAADPLVVYEPAKDGQPEKLGGIGEEDLVVITLPYIRSAREGVQRLGSLLEKYGTYENNGIAFSDHDEVWYLESVGGHHWIARRVPDNCYAVLPNMFTEDEFDLEDATTTQKNFMASADIREFIEKNQLAIDKEPFNARLAFGSHDDADHVYNTPRMWYGQRYFNPTTVKWDGEDAEFNPQSDNLPWCRKSEHLITVEDVKTVLSSTYQGTPYSIYAKGPKSTLFRPIGINRTSNACCLEIRNNVPEEISAVQWFAFGSNVYNTFTPILTNTDTIPAYFTDTALLPSTDDFFWTSRIIAAMADPHHDALIPVLERYQLAVGAKVRHILKEVDDTYKAGDNAVELNVKANQQIADYVHQQTEDLLDKVLYESSMDMQNNYARSDN